VVEFTWVDGGRALYRAIRDILAARLIAIDTEYDSFRYFREKLCLIQINTDRKIFLLDPLGGLDLSFLKAYFADSTVPKIFHAGDNDIRLLKRDYGFEFRNVFDVQRAAALLGCKDLALAGIIRTVMGTDLQKSKKIQRSQWDTRPLSQEQISYAVQDITYLTDLYRIFRKEIMAKGLEEEAARSFEQIASVSWTEKTLDPFGHLRIKGSREMTRSQRTRLKALYRWRFRKAKETNTAMFMILSDQHLSELARSKIRSLSSLRRSEKLPPGKADRFGPEIVSALNESPDFPAQDRSKNA